MNAKEKIEIKAMLILATVMTKEQLIEHLNELVSSVAIDFAEFLRTFDALSKENGFWVLVSQISSDELYKGYLNWSQKSAHETTLPTTEKPRFIYQNREVVTLAVMGKRWAGVEDSNGNTMIVRTRCLDPVNDDHGKVCNKCGKHAMYHLCSGCLIKTYEHKRK